MAKSVYDAAKDLVDKLEEIHEDPSYHSVWTLAHVHGNPYKGPDYAKELAELKIALDATNGNS